ncbi:response regulator [Desertibaculum subflavum]|uniref:response regulator n=1 Tax=Desertibaculum subflavum TaxID=2268458 RepID=UPI000E66F4DD
MANEPPLILVVDDDPDFADFLRSLLDRNGFRASSAGTARAALRALGEGRVDLVITDVVMPDMDGIEFLRSLPPAARGLPVIAITGSPLNAHGTLSRVMHALGATQVLPKPLPNAELLAAIRNALATAPRRVGLNQTT